MSDKLDPKPQPHSNEKGWEELNQLLQDNFSNRHESNQFRPAINVDEYVMSADEIIKESEKQGYTVEQTGNILRFS